MAWCKHFLSMGERAMNGVFPHQRLARSRGSTHYNRMALVQRFDGLQLEVIQREGKDRRRVEARRSHHRPLWITATLGTSGGRFSSRRPEQNLTFNRLSSRLVFSWRGKHRIFPGGFHEQLNPPRHGTSASPFSDQDLTAQKYSPPF